ncbi:UNVERIFIED_CONTAM: putative transposase [Acetivibrio alkalicellulosi]
MHNLCLLLEKKDITFLNEIDFKALKNELYTKEWVVYCKPPFKTPENVIEYLGRYTHKIAITNSRLITVKDNRVYFKWRDYKDNNKEKVMNLSVFEFIRRFLMHVLPKGFFKIRHFGLLSNRNKKTKLKLCQKLTGSRFTEVKRLSRREIIKKIFGADIFCCPLCGSEFINRIILRE